MSSRGTLRKGVHSNRMATGGRESSSLMGRQVYPSLVTVAVLIGWLPMASGAAAPVEPSSRLSETRRLMGAPWTITVWIDDAEAGEGAIAAAFDEIARLEKVLSDYDPKSELSRLSARAAEPAPTPVSEDLWRVLVLAEGVRGQSDGAFDIAVGPLTQLWRQARRSGRLPRPDKLAAARAAVGEGTVEFVLDRQAIRLPKPGTRLDPGGIGMGYAADRAMEVLADHGVEAALIDASGDVVVSGPPPGTTGWQIRVAPLEPGGDPETLELAHASVTTSGDAYQAVEIDDIRYSHIVDPRTGLGVVGPAAVTVIAADATTADALATAASVLGPEAGARLIESVPGVSARFVWRTGDAVEIRVTDGWPGRE